MFARPPSGPGPGLSRVGWTFLALSFPILAGGFSACCVAPPRAEDLLAVGFRTPEQTFRTFQTAVRADEPGLERRCFSSEFVRRNGLSELAFREFWDRLESEHPFLRKGITDAEPAAPSEIRRDLARLVAVSHGRRMEIAFVLEDFCEAWEGGDRRIDEAAPFRERSGLQSGDDGTRWMYGRMPLPEGIAPDRITELRIGREWKIDGFEVIEAEDAAKASPSEAKLSLSEAKLSTHAAEPSSRAAKPSSNGGKAGDGLP